MLAPPCCFDPVIALEPFFHFVFGGLVGLCVVRLALMFRISELDPATKADLQRRWSFSSLSLVSVSVLCILILRAGVLDLALVALSVTMLAHLFCTMQDYRTIFPRKKR